MTDEEIAISNEAAEYVKKHRNELISKFASLEKFFPDRNPVSVFMAGSPGAGKTEFSKRLIEEFESKPVRIDADEIREWIPDHKTADSQIYQRACTDGVNKLYDFVLKNRLNVILDGTFAYAGAADNVERSIRKNRLVEIYYLYQDPVISWQFTKNREIIEHRNVPRSVFIKSFLASREHVNTVKRKFPGQVSLNVVIKNFEVGFEDLQLNVDTVDPFLPKLYSVDQLESLLL